MQDIPIFKGDIVVTPHSLRPEIRGAIHSCHIGIEGLENAFIGPGVNAEIRKYISTCAVCNMYATAQQKEIMMSHESPYRHWEKEEVNLMPFQG